MDFTRHKTNLVVFSNANPLPSQSVFTGSQFPIPQPHSRQKRGEDWKAFFARRCEENKRKEEKEMPAQQQSHQSREHSAMNHSMHGKSSTTMVFEWQPDDEFGGFCQCIRLTKAEIPTTWMSYSKSTRVYDSFHNEWDLCDALDPTSIPNGDWEEDNFPPASAPSEPTPAPPPPPPPLSSFLKDIEAYFGHYEVAPSMQYTRSVERFVLILHFHLGYCLAASTTTSRGRSTTFDDWTRKTQWTHLYKLIGDTPTNITSIPDAQKHVITCFIGYLVTLPQSQLSDIPPDLWDLGPDLSLSVSNAHIRVSYVQQPKQRLYITESLSSNLDRRLAHFRPVFADYIVYKQHRHEFMNWPSRKSGTSSWWPSYGGWLYIVLGSMFSPPFSTAFHRKRYHLASCWDINGQTYFDDELSEEEVDFKCGTYYVHTHDRNLKSSPGGLGPRPGLPQD
ncbi:hypothetical protein F4604DRAFT_1692019 [Suillus subluteus]|nr:hypothetical protein F4604DRAFT_1692019 [Suillus subluteus]